MDNKNYVSASEKMKEGAILKAFGQNYLVSVTPILNIDRVKWSVVKIGSSGKDFTDFYLTVKQMRQLCEEIENGVAGKKLSADSTSQYPGAYKYVTGENGSKKLNIGGGQKGIRVQTQVNKDGKWDNKMSVVPWEDLKEMAFLFRLVTGLIPVMGGSYYHNLFKAFLEGEKDRSKYHSNFNELENGEYIPVIEEKGPAPTKEEKTEPEKKPQKPSTTEVAAPEEEFMMRIETPLTDLPDGSGKAMKCYTQDNRLVPVIFKNSVMNLNLDRWRVYELRANTVGAKIKFKAIFKAERYYVTALVL